MLFEPKLLGDSVVRSMGYSLADFLPWIVSHALIFCSVHFFFFHVELCLEKRVLSFFLSSNCRTHSSSKIRRTGRFVACELSVFTLSLKTTLSPRWSLGASVWPHKLVFHRANSPVRKATVPPQTVTGTWVLTPPGLVWHGWSLACCRCFLGRMKARQAEQLRFCIWDRVLLSCPAWPWTCHPPTPTS
jgi:hypothetical protein